MSRLALSLSIVSLFVLGTGVARAETAKVSVRIADLRVKPSSDARSKLRLGKNRSVDVLSKSDDGQWVKIRAEVLRGEEPVRFEGWVAAAHLGIKGVSEPVASAPADLDWATETPAPTAAPAESWETPAASTDSAPSADAWGAGASDAPAAASSDASSDSGWGSDSGSSSESTDSPESDW